MQRPTLFWLACSAILFASTSATPVAHAQEGEQGDAFDAPQGTEIVVDERQRQLQREQDEAEGHGASSERLDALADPVAESQAVTGRRQAAADAEQEALNDELLHYHQFGLRVGGGATGLIGVRYKSGAACDDSGQTFCKRLGAPVLDIDLSYAFGQAVELTLLGRFGMAHDSVSGVAPMIFGIGVRGYTPADSFVKAFFGGRAFIDYQNSSVPNWNKIDFGVRGEVGLQIDFIRYFGIYLQLSAGVQPLNAFTFIADLTGGIQARFP